MRIEGKLYRIAVLVLASALAGSGLAGPSGESLLSSPATVAVPAPTSNCFTPDVKRCCASSGATLSVPCNADGAQWTCSTTPSVNELFKTTVSAATGWVGSQETSHEVKCVYKKVSCGNLPGRCNLDGTDTTAVCKEKEVTGGLCESATSISGLEE